MVKEIKETVKSNWVSLAVQVVAIVIPVIGAMVAQSLFISREMGSMSSSISSLEKQVAQSVSKDVIDVLADKANSEHRTINKKIEVETNQRIQADNEIRSMVINGKR